MYLIASTGTEEPAGYVHLTGVIKSGVVPGVAFTLPIGYRPPFDSLAFEVTSNSLRGQVNVNLNGTVVPQVGNNGDFFLDEIVFSTGQSTFPTGPIGPTGLQGAQGVPAAGSSVPIELWHVVGGGGEPAFANGWIQHDVIAHTASFRKRPDGIVEMRGLIRGGSIGQTVFTLPAGYRPSGDGTDGNPVELYIPIHSSGGIGRMYISRGSMEEW